MFSKMRPLLAQTSRVIFHLAGLFCVGLGLFNQMPPALAASGMPDSTEFGYGAHLDPWGPQAELALNVAAGIGLDWIAIDFDWSELWPGADSTLDLQPLDHALQIARQFHLNTLISISNAPSWAQTPAGPDPERTTVLVTLLAERYRGTLLAIELFPAANTAQAWGVAPDPLAYTRLVQKAQSALQRNGSPVVLVAGGLAPRSTPSNSLDLDDLEFLQGMYAAGAAATSPIISLRPEAPAGDPMQPATTETPAVLRRYEAIRQVMVSNQHENGLIWITGYTWPAKLQSGPISAQTRWLNQALLLMKSQLYIGAAFFEQLNSQPADGMSPLSLILEQDGAIALHPALNTLGQIITLGKTGENPGFQLYLNKRILTGPQKIVWKGSM